jgi:hypothetical protein
MCVASILAIAASCTPYIAYSSSCIISEQMVLDWSEKYKDHVRISVRENDDEYLVEALFPSAIEGEAYTGIWLFKGQPVYDATLMDHDFSMRLATWKNENGFAHVFYSIKPYLAADNFLTTSYGEDCGISIQYFVDFSLAIKQ